MTPPVSLDPVDSSTPPPVPAAQPVSPPASSAPAPAASSAPTPFNPRIIDRLHLVIGGGYNTGTQVAIDADAYRNAAPSYRGGMFLLQPSYSVFLNRNFDIRIGGDLRYSSLSVEPRAGRADSSIGALSLGGMLEGAWLPHQHFGIGLNLALGYMGLMSSNADVGAPVTATLDFGREGGFFLGVQPFVTFLNQVVRVGVSIDTMPGGFRMDTGAGNPPVATSVRPMITPFIGIDGMEIIAWATRGN
ncbi:MAG: hypothetical protein U1F57_09920 [bacterium]